jgi:hypothetical protein
MQFPFGSLQPTKPVTSADIWFGMLTAGRQFKALIA